MTAALEGGEWSAARPGRTLPPGKSRYPFYRRLGGPQDRSGRSENLAPTGIRSRTVQPVAQSLYRLSYPAHTSGQRTIMNFCKRRGMRLSWFDLTAWGKPCTSWVSVRGLQSLRGDIRPRQSLWSWGWRYTRPHSPLIDTDRRTIRWPGCLKCTLVTEIIVKWIYTVTKGKQLRMRKCSWFLLFPVKSCRLNWKP